MSLTLKPEVARSKGRVALTTNMVMGGTVTDDESDEWLVLDQKVCQCLTSHYSSIGTGILRNSTKDHDLVCCIILPCEHFTNNDCHLGFHFQYASILVKQKIKEA
jgi:hypothetical protein